MFYLEASGNLQAWKLLLGRAVAMMRTSATVAEISLDTDVGRMLKELLPWSVERAQVVKAPKARRWPPDIGFLHRGAFLELIDDSLDIETEAVRNIQFPRARFVKPVR